MGILKGRQMNGNYGAPLLLFVAALAIAGQTPANAQSCPPFDTCINEGTLTFSNQVVGTVSAGQLITFTFWDSSDYIPGQSGVTGDFREGPRNTCSFFTPQGSGCQIE